MNCGHLSDKVTVFIELNAGTYVIVFL